MAGLGYGSKGEVSDVNDPIAGLQSSESPDRSRHSEGRSRPQHFATRGSVLVEAEITLSGKGDVGAKMRY